MIYRCIARLFTNQCMNVPSGGIIFGYFFAFCAAASSSDNCGPGYRGASFLRRAPWDGGTNFVGFSRTNCLGGCFDVAFGLGTLEAWRTVRTVEEGVESLVRHIDPLWGRRKRGIEVVGGILGYG